MLESEDNLEADYIVEEIEDRELWFLLSLKGRIRGTSRSSDGFATRASSKEDTIENCESRNGNFAHSPPLEFPSSSADNDTAEAARSIEVVSQFIHLLGI